MQRWYPVARSEEAVARHIVQVMLLDHDIALWRDDAGCVNAWENRCPHRGVRLSVGFNTGSELRCQYHGWHFASGSGQCRFIPAHPTQKPASTLHATVYGVAERHGHIWVRLAGSAAGPPELPPVAPGATGSGMTLRSMFIRASAAAVSGALLRGYCLDGSALAPVTAHDAYTLTAHADGAPAGPDSRAVFLLQPVSRSRTVVHGTLFGATAAGGRVALLRRHNAQLSALRNALECPA